MNKCIQFQYALLMSHSKAQPRWCGDIGSHAESGWTASLEAQAGEQTSAGPGVEGLSRPADPRVTVWALLRGSDPRGSVPPRHRAVHYGGSNRATGEREVGGVSFCVWTHSFAERPMSHTLQGQTLAPTALQWCSRGLRQPVRAGAMFCTNLLQQTAPFSLPFTTQIQKRNTHVHLAGGNISQGSYTFSISKFHTFPDSNFQTSL